MSHTYPHNEPNVARVKFTIRAFCHEVMVEARTWDEAERAAPAGDALEAAIAKAEGKE